MVTAVNNGVTVITATTADGGFTAQCVVTVIDETEGDLYVISTEPEDDETGVRVNKLIRVFFNVPIEANTDFENIKLINTNTSEEIEIDKKVDAGRNLIINMASVQERLEYDTTYEVVIPRHSVKCKQTDSIMVSDYTFTFTTAESKKPVEGLNLQQNYFIIGSPNAAATIVPEITPADATDYGLEWSAGNNGGITPSGAGSYRLASSSGSNIGTLEHIYREDTSWGVFRPLSPGTVTVNVTAEGGAVQESCIIDVFFGYGIVTGTRVGVADAILASRHIVGLTELDRVQLKAAKVRGEESLSVADIILIARKIVGLTDTFPAEEA